MLTELLPASDRLTVRLERQVVEFVDDEQLRLGVEREAFIELAFVVGLDQRRHHGRGDVAVVLLA